GQAGGVHDERIRSGAAVELDGPRNHGHAVGEVQDQRVVATLAVEREGGGIAEGDRGRAVEAVRAAVGAGGGEYEDVAAVCARDDQAAADIDDGAPPDGAGAPHVRHGNAKGQAGNGVCVGMGADDIETAAVGDHLHVGGVGGAVLGHAVAPGHRGREVGGSGA